MVEDSVRNEKPKVAKDVKSILPALIDAADDTYGVDLKVFVKIDPLAIRHPMVPSMTSSTQGQIIYGGAVRSTVKVCRHIPITAVCSHSSCPWLTARGPPRRATASRQHRDSTVPRTEAQPAA